MVPPPISAGDGSGGGYALLALLNVAAWITLLYLVGYV